MNNYAAYLTARLSALGLSRNALARALGHRGASQVSRWCAGKAVPREKARAKIEATLARIEYLTSTIGRRGGTTPRKRPRMPQEGRSRAGRGTREPPLW